LEENLQEKVAPQPPRGRAELLERYRSSFPDAEEPNDDTLYDHAIGSIEETEGRFNNLVGANEALAQRVMEDPQFGVFLSLIVGEGKSVPYAFAKVYGRDVLESDPDELEAGHKEYLQRVADEKEASRMSSENVQKYFDALMLFADKNQLSEDEVAELHKGIENDVDNFLLGIIPMEYIGYKWKGMNYDKDVADAAETGKIEGANSKIEAKMKADLAARTQSRATAPSTFVRDAPRKTGNILDELKPVEE
jgi:hypothetical protein